jgi:hypothetical protein
MTTFKDTLKNMAISGAAPAISAIFTNPFDVAKTRLQMQLELQKPNASATAPYTGPWNCMRQTFQLEGVRGLQRGLGIAMLREGSKCFFRIGLFAPILATLHPHSSSTNHGAPFWKKLVAGSASGFVAAVVCNPLDLVKSRMQASGSLASSHHTYNNSFDAFRQIFHNEGGLGAFWNGYRINVARSITFTSVMMATNSEAHRYLLNHSHVIVIPEGPWRDASCALVGAIAGVMVMNPIDVIRTRMYNQPAGPHTVALYPDTSILATARQIARSEGVLSFWKGGVAHCTRVGPHTTLTFVLIAWMKKRFYGD